MGMARPDASRVDTALLAHGLRAAYGIEISSIVRMKHVCGVVAADGRKLIWKSTGGQSAHHRLAAVCRLAGLLRGSGVNVAAPLPNRMGALVTRLADGQVGYLQTWLPGRHLLLVNRQERLAAAAALGLLHSAAHAVEWPRHPQLLRGGLPEKLILKRNFLLQVWGHLEHACPDVRGMKRPILTACETAIDRLQSLAADVTLSHRDVAPHNILWQGDHQLGLIDFDQAGLDDPFTDLAQLVNHGIYLGALGPGYFADVVAVYTRNYPLPPRRKAVLDDLFLFPDVFVRTVVDWAKTGWVPAHRRKLLYAMTLERRRQKLLGV
jgi:Ser/Thr protein kinase RdoA (MazF antagonist)